MSLCAPIPLSAEEAVNTLWQDITSRSGFLLQRRGAPFHFWWLFPLQANRHCMRHKVLHPVDNTAMTFVSMTVRAIWVSNYFIAYTPQFPPPCLLHMQLYCITLTRLSINK